MFELIFTCPYISDSRRASAEFEAAIENAPYLKDRCFDYIPDYKVLEYEMDENGVSLVRTYLLLFYRNVILQLLLIYGYYAIY